MANTTVYPYGQGGQLPSGYPIADDLNTNSAQQALSARQGKIIGDYIFGSYSNVDLSGVTVSSYGLGAGTSTSNKWTTNGKHCVIPVTPGQKYKLIAASTTINGAWYAFLSSSFVEPSSTSSDNYYAPGCSRVWLSIDTSTHVGSADVTVPGGAGYLCYCPKDGNQYESTWTIQLFTEPGINDTIEELVSDSTDELQSQIDTLRGTFDEEVVFSELVVLSNNTAKITITKGEDGVIRVNNIASTSGAYALIAFPSTLVHGKQYMLTFDLSAGFTASESWWLGFVDASYQPVSGGVTLYPGTASYSYKFTYNATVKYMRLASTSQNTGAYAYFSNLSISNKTTVAELTKKVEELGESSSSSSGNLDAVIRQARYVATTPTTEPLTLLHFTDIHGDAIASLSILNFYQEHSSQIDDMVQTGDAVYYYWNDSGQGYDWFQSNGLQNSLFVLGNHDGCANDNSQGWKEGSADWDFKGKEWDFDTYFAPYISTRGITPPTGYDDSTSPYYKACYWHKDYSSAKVRVIGLDCMHFNDGVRYTSNDQETWLAAKLQETLTSGNSAYGYSVVFLCHYALDDYSGNNETWVDANHRFTFNQNATGGHIMDRDTGNTVKCHDGTSYTAEARFSMRNRVGTVGSTSYTKGNDNPIADVIQSWMNSGGKYIAWLSGHTHTQYMYYPAKYPNMLVIGLPQAGNTRGTNFNDRSNDSEMHTCANLLVIDTQNKLLKIIRVGCTMNKWLTEFKWLAYNYESKYVERQ